MNIEITQNGEPVDAFYRFRLEACCEILSPQLNLWLPLHSRLAKGDTLQLKGDGRLLFTGRVQQVKEVERSRLRVEAFESLQKELLLNFHKEQWGHILKEVYPDFAFDGSDFEQLHYSMKGSIRDHLVQLKASLERRSKKSYYFYLDEQNTLQVRAQGQSRGRGQPGALIEQGRCCDTYQAFPLLVGQASSEGLAERLELIIDGGKQRLRVWWGELKEDIKDSVEDVKDALVQGSVQNQSNRTIYAILSESVNIEPIYPSQTLEAYIAGVVDIQGKVVYKMGEWSDVRFSIDYQFEFIRGARQLLFGAVKDITGKFGEPYGVYLGEDTRGELQFIHSDKGVTSKDMLNWFNKARMQAQ